MIEQVHETALHICLKTTKPCKNYHDTMLKADVVLATTIKDSMNRSAVHKVSACKGCFYHGFANAMGSQESNHPRIPPRHVFDVVEIHAYQMGTANDQTIEGIYTIHVTELCAWCKQTPRLCTRKSTNPSEGLLK